MVGDSLPSVAYFSMEIGPEPAVPTYAGGLGVLASDILRAAADLCVPMVGMTFLHRQGYFRQQLDTDGQQVEEPALWTPEDHLEEMRPRIAIPIEDRPVHNRAWRYQVTRHAGDHVPVYLLDTALPENDAEAQTLTDHLYGGDECYRLAQEVVLDLGGVAMLRALGHATWVSVT